MRIMLGGIGYKDQSGGGPFSAGQKKIVQLSWTIIVMAKIVAPIGNKRPTVIVTSLRSKQDASGMVAFASRLMAPIARRFLEPDPEFDSILDAECELVSAVVVD